MHIVAKVSDVAYGPLVILKLMLYRCLRMSNKFLLQAGFIYLFFFLFRYFLCGLYLWNIKIGKLFVFILTSFQLRHNLKCIYNKSKTLFYKMLPYLSHKHKEQHQLRNTGSLKHIFLVHIKLGHQPL